MIRLYISNQEFAIKCFYVKDSEDGNVTAIVGCLGPTEEFSITEIS